MEIFMSEQTNNSEYNTVTLSLDDGTECECAIIRIFPAGENDYIALLPLEGEAAEQDEVYLYRYVENDGREPSLLNIESDEEYELVSVFLWWGSIKLYFASLFPHFFQPFQQRSDADQPELPDLMGAMNAQIRALTSGDVTKEKEVLQMDCWRALTELDAKAHDIQILKSKQNGHK